jgi:hypothetical protein
MSRGGARIVVEEPLEVGDDFTVVFGDDETHPRPMRVVWTQPEAGGQIVGLQFLDATGSVPPRYPNGTEG